MKKLYPFLVITSLLGCAGGGDTTTSSITNCSVTIVPNKASLQELMNQIELTGGEIVLPPDVSIQEADAPIEIVLCSDGVIKDNDIKIDGTLELARTGAFSYLEVLP